MPARSSRPSPSSGCRDHGCDRDLYSRGLCNPHYLRWRKGRDDLWAEPIRTMRTTSGFDFQRDVIGWLDRSGGPNACHLWTRSTKTKGYGQVSVDGRMRGIHQLVFEHENGPVPVGEMVRHTCGVRLCGNIRHLVSGTSAMNSADMIAHGNSLRGERQSHVKLTAAEVRQIRDLLASGWSKYRTAREYGVSESAIRHVANQTTWGWLP